MTTRSWRRVSPTCRTGPPACAVRRPRLVHRGEQLRHALLDRKVLALDQTVGEAEQQRAGRQRDLRLHVVLGADAERQAGVELEKLRLTPGQADEWWQVPRAGEQDEAAARVPLAVDGGDEHAVLERADEQVEPRQQRRRRMAFEAVAANG